MEISDGHPSEVNVTKELNVLEAPVGTFTEVWYYCRWRKAHVVGRSAYGGVILELLYPDGRPPTLVRWDSPSPLLTRVNKDCK